MTYPDPGRQGVDQNVGEDNTVSRLSGQNKNVFNYKSLTSAWPSLAVAGISLCGKSRGSKGLSVHSMRSEAIYE